ncbi:MAG: sulfurtransferase [Balneolaceae bacterium]
MKPMKTRLLIIPVLIMIFLACETLDNHPEGYANPHLLADASWLAENLEDENIRIVDMRDDPGEDFIPGAVYFGGAPELIDTTHEVAGYLKNAEDFASLMSEYGITQDQTVVIYDEGKSLRSSRLFLALEYYGHTDVRILNGGFEAWKEENRETVSEPADPEPATFTVTMNEIALCDLQTVLNSVGDENTVIVDARPADQFSGETVRAERGGHIPGAVNLYWEEMISEEGVPVFKTAEKIREIHAEHGITPDKRVITHCHSNMQASNAYFVLRLMGYTDITSYEGSWSEYGNNPDVPVEM